MKNQNKIKSITEAKYYHLGEKLFLSKVNVKRLAKMLDFGMLNQISLIKLNCYIRYTYVTNKICV